MEQNKTKRYEPIMIVVNNLEIQDVLTVSIDSWKTDKFFEDIFE